MGSVSSNWNSLHHRNAVHCSRVVPWHVHLVDVPSASLSIFRREFRGNVTVVEDQVVAAEYGCSAGMSPHALHLLFDSLRMAQVVGVMDGIELATRLRKGVVERPPACPGFPGEEFSSEGPIGR